LKDATHHHMEVIMGYSILMQKSSSAWAHLHQKPNTEPKLNRNISFSVVRFGFGFLICQLQCSASGAVLICDQTELPRNRLLAAYVNKLVS
jgi:hypothetical protein